MASKEKTVMAAAPVAEEGTCCGGGCRTKPASVQELAYLKWLAATGGTPVGPDQTDGFWFEAEKELAAPDGE
jgi:hypothetical protein